MQVAILFAIWVLFGLAVTALYVSKVFNQIEYIYGDLAWTLLAGTFAVVTWFILKKNDSQQKTSQNL